MNFLKKVDITPKNILKFAGLICIAIILLAFVLSIGKSILGSVGNRKMNLSFAPVSTQSVAFDRAMPDSYMTKSSAGYAQGEMATLSIRNISPGVPPIYGGSVGNTAEMFEVTDYSATIETRNREDACGRMRALKSFSYVIFENSNESDTYCNYRFKVEKERVSQVLTAIKDLNPKELSENSYTIQEQVNDFTNRLEILENKRASIDETLKTALAAYTDITKLATNNQDTASLAKIIDSKMQTIERFTQESIAVNEQIEYLTRAKADQLDRLNYTYFSVYVYENKFIDRTELADSWKFAFKDFFTTVNKALQDATINVIAFVFLLVPYLLYLFIIIFVARYVWKIGKKIWLK